MSGSRIWILLYPCSHSSCSDSTARQHPGTIHKQPSARTLVRIQRRRKTNQKRVKSLLTNALAGCLRTVSRTHSIRPYISMGTTILSYIPVIYTPCGCATQGSWPYVQLSFNQDPRLKKMLAGVINRQFKCINIDPYANAFNMGPTGGEWMSDMTDMKPELHERKWEIDSLCYPIRLAYQYWKVTGDTSIYLAKNGYKPLRMYCGPSRTATERRQWPLQIPT